MPDQLIIVLLAKTNTQVKFLGQCPMYEAIIECKSILYFAK